MPIPVVEDTYQTQWVSHAVAPSENTFVNTMFFRDTATVKRSHSAVADLLETKLVEFYNVAQGGGGNRIQDFISRVVNVALQELKVYDLNFPAPRIPELRSPALTQTGTTTVLPNECAVVMSYAAGPLNANGGSIDPRKRGRIYVGPLTSNSATFTVGTDPDVRVNSGLLSTLQLAGEFLLDDINTDEMQWVQYSRMNNLASTVDGGFINNRLDTQRRRGEFETSRVLFPA